MVSLQWLVGPENNKIISEIVGSWRRRDRLTSLAACFGGSSGIHMCRRRVRVTILGQL
eukprot:SAG31_NODE_40905_length_278_cov_1.139665_1_plen_57_part_10